MSLHIEHATFSIWCSSVVPVTCLRKRCPDYCVRPSSSRSCFSSVFSPNKDGGRVPRQLPLGHARRSRRRKGIGSSPLPVQICFPDAIQSTHLIFATLLLRSPLSSQRCFPASWDIFAAPSSGHPSAPERQRHRLYHLIWHETRLVRRTTDLMLAATGARRWKW